MLSLFARNRDPTEEEKFWKAHGESIRTAFMRLSEVIPKMGFDLDQIEVIPESKHGLGILSAPEYPPAAEISYPPSTACVLLGELKSTKDQLNHEMRVAVGPHGAWTLFVAPDAKSEGTFWKSRYGVAVCKTPFQVVLLRVKYRISVPMM